MPNPISLALSFSGGFFTGFMMCTHYTMNYGKLHPLELSYKKHCNSLIDDLISKNQSF